MTTVDKHSNEETGNIAVISLGSNCGNREENVSKALDWLMKVTEDCETSHIYETPEIHGIGNPYMNAVCRCRFKSDLAASTCMTKNYEKNHGRDEKCRKRGDVPIDIDIVIWENAIIRPLDYSRSFFQIGYDALINR